MKKSILTVILCVSTYLISPNLYAKNSSFKKVETCQYDYSEINFCSKKNISKYKNALKNQKMNFAKKYILLNIGTNDYRTYTAIDTQTGWVYPLNFDIMGFKDSDGNVIRPAEVQFNIKNSDLCIKGSIESYRNSYDNVSVCFAVIKNNPLGMEFTWRDIPQQMN